jgi:hypothetical protein
MGGMARQVGVKKASGVSKVRGRWAEERRMFRG